MPREPYYAHAGVTLYQGHALDVLREMVDSSVACAITSPPYFGLRAYGTAPQIWGGRQDCEHDWLDATYVRNNDQTAGPKQRTNVGAIGRDAPVANAFCSRCNGWRGELGLEPDLALFIDHLVEVFREVRRVLQPWGSFWLNCGDSYNGSGGAGGDYNAGGLREGQPRYPGRRVKGLKPKDLMMVPARLALALQDDGWWLRQKITWAKTAPMPESVTDRPTCATEDIYLLTKQPIYYYDAVAVAEPSLSGHGSGNGYRRDYQLSRGGRGQDEPWQPQPTRQLRNFWLLGPEACHEAHFAVMPQAIPERCILAGTSARGQCPRCGKPWRRVAERERQGVRNTRAGSNGQQIHREGVSHNLYPIGSATVGWEPSCSCNAGDPVPQTVLDPFAGSGTTLWVASRLGRHGVGIELNPEYCELAVKRTRQQAMVLEV